MKSASADAAVEQDSPSRRWIDLFEVILGAFLVIGHNVFHILPSEVPLLFIVFWISPRLRRGRWDLSQLRRPDSWVRTIALAVAGATVLQLGSAYVVEPLAARIWHQPEQVSSVLQAATHDWKFALRSLAIVWIFAAFGEELGYRGYLLSRAADLGNRSGLAYVAAMVYVAVLFAFAHFYKGPVGIVDSAWLGLVLGAVYLLARRNLWAAILAHGLSDTFAVVALMIGWAN